MLDIERCNRAYRGELLDQHMFLPPANLREATPWWMIEYNEKLPQDAPGGLTPMEAHKKAAPKLYF